LRNERLKIEETLSGLAEVPDEKLDLADTALLLAIHFHSYNGMILSDLTRYRQHLADITRGLQEQAHKAASQAGVLSVPLELRVSSLQALFGVELNYQGDVENYDDPSNGLLIDVIDRRQGLPVALGILFIHAARSLDWTIDGLNFPGHFLVRLETDGARRIVDPFAGGMPVEAVHMRALLKGVQGNHAELEPEFYEPCTNRQILLRLQNNLKTRLLREGDLATALQVVEASMLFCPQYSSLWYESGLLKSRLGQIHGAIADFKYYRENCRDEPTIQKITVLLAELKEQLRQ